MLSLDTHILIFSLADALNKDERSLIAEQECGISTMVMWEIEMLSMRQRIQYNLEHPAVIDALHTLTIWPLDVRVCRRLRDLDFRSDPAGEIIAATSLAFDVPLLTRDRTIRRSKIVPLAR